MTNLHAEAPVPAPRIVAADNGFALALWARVIVVIWRQPVRAQPLQEIATLVADLAMAETTFGVVTVVETGVMLPGAEERAEMARLLGLISRSFNAVVNEDEGFYVAAVRGVSTSLALLTKKMTPSKIFGSITDAARWAVTIDPTAGPAEALERAIRTTRVARSLPHAALGA